MAGDRRWSRRTDNGVVATRRMRERVIRRGRPQHVASSPRPRCTSEWARPTSTSTGTATKPRPLRALRGSAALITPWNAPFMLSTWKVGPGARGGLHRRGEATGVGPTYVLADGRHRRGGRPAAGVLNVVQGLGQEAGAALTRIRTSPASPSPARPTTAQSIVPSRRRAPHAAVARARREVAVRGVRRRRPRGGGRAEPSASTTTPARSACGDAPARRALDLRGVPPAPLPATVRRTLEHRRARWSKATTRSAR